jgi:hypothetical protein
MGIRFVCSIPRRLPHLSCRPFRELSALRFVVKQPSYDVNIAGVLFNVNRNLHKGAIYFDCSFVSRVLLFTLNSMSLCATVARMAKDKGEKMYTIRQAAQLTGASESSLRVWLSNDAERVKRFPNARKETSPIGDYWLIPESDLKSYKNPGRGRPRKKPTDKGKNKG